MHCVPRARTHCQCGLCWLWSADAVASYTLLPDYLSMSLLGHCGWYRWLHKAERFGWWSNPVKCLDQKCPPQACLEFQTVCDGGTKSAAKPSSCILLSFVHLTVFSVDAAYAWRLEEPAQGRHTGVSEAASCQAPCWQPRFKRAKFYSRFLSVVSLHMGASSG